MHSLGDMEGKGQMAQVGERDMNILSGLMAKLVPILISQEIRNVQQSPLPALQCKGQDLALNKT